MNPSRTALAKYFCGLANMRRFPGHQVLNGTESFDSGFPAMTVGWCGMWLEWQSFATFSFKAQAPSHPGVCNFASSSHKQKHSCWASGIVARHRGRRTTHHASQISGLHVQRTPAPCCRMKVEVPTVGPWLAVESPKNIIRGTAPFIEILHQRCMLSRSSYSKGSWDFR